MNELKNPFSMLVFLFSKTVSIIIEFEHGSKIDLTLLQLTSRIAVMESGDSMERDGVWIPLTPGKPIPTRLGLGLGLGLHSVQPMGGRHNCKAELISGKGTGIKNLNEAFPFIGSLNATGYLYRNGINEMYGLKAGVHEHEAASDVAGKDPESNAADQNDTSCVREEAVKVPHSELDSKNAHGVHESQAGIGSVPSPSETKNSRKRRNDGIDMNKKPSQRPRMKKHRPKILDDSKPKKVPKAQTPRASTPRPKTPKPVTPNRVQERRKPARKNTFTRSTSCMQSSTSYGYKDVVQDAQSASTSSIIVVKSCKRSLDFNHHLVDRESCYVSKSHEQPKSFNYDLGKYNYFGKIVTSKRNTPRRSRFQKKCLKASEDLLGDNNEQCHQDISVVRNQELAETHVRRFVYFYQRRKKSIPTLQVYQRKFRANQCLQNSKKSGPNFPSIFKKQRAKRRKATMNGNCWYIKAFEDGKNHVRRSHRKHIQTTRKSVHNRVNKSKDHNGVVKPNLHTDERFLHVFVTKKRKRSIRHTRRRENIMDLPIFKAMPCESEKRRENIMDLSIFKAMPCESEKCLSQQEEDFLKITECFPLQEVPIQTIESFTSVHRNVQLVDNSVDALKSLQLQEVPVLESQSLVPGDQDIPLSKEELNNLYVREMGEYVRRKLENLDINGPCKELVVRDRNFSGTLVKTDPPKKRKVLPKVNLDEETLRVWKLLMENDGSEPVEEMDKEKEEWWERQRKVFRGRVDSFIAKMHLIQGNRRFSQWKGSVVDSVVGVYLTQNVSDHLSSSAFMSLAARFPVKSSSKEVCDHGDVETSQELVISNTVVDGGFSMNNETEKDMRTSCADVSDATPTAKPEQEGVSNTFLVQDKPCDDGNSNAFRKLLDIEEVDYLKQFYSSGNDELPLNESRENEDLIVRKEDEEQSATSFDLSISHEPCATISDVNVGLCETSVFRNREREVVGEKNGDNEHLKHCESEFKGKEGVSNPFPIQDKPLVDGNSNAFRKHPDIEEVDYLKHFSSSGNDESPLNACRDNGDLNASKEREEQSVTSFDLPTSHEPCATISDVDVGLCEISVFRNIEREVVGEKNGGDEHLKHLESELTGKEGISNPILVQDKPCVDGNSNAFRKLLDIEEVDYLKQFYSSRNDELPLNESRDNGVLNASKEAEDQSATSFYLPRYYESCLTISDVNMGSCETSVFGNIEREVVGEENEGNERLNHSDGEFLVQQKATPEERIIVAPVCTLNSEDTIEESVDAVNNHPSMNAIPLDPRSTGKKKSRSEEKQETKTDWESLRRTYCKTGGKETNENNMDAVDWDAVRRATVEEIADTIVERGMNNVLAARIKEFLERMVKDHGTIDLEWLRDVPPDKAKEFLLSIQGIGLKSVECVRLLTLHHLAFPVDTNVGRVATRLGWVPLQPLPEEVQIHLLNAYPMMDSIQKYLFPRLCTLDQRTLYELHYQLITFGKVFCTKKSPNCNACPMRAECRHYASAFASARLALPGPKESTVTSIVPAANEQNHSMLNTPPSSFDLELDTLGSSYHAQNTEPIIEVPPSPEPEDALPIIRDIEDYYCESDDEIPTIRLNTEEFRETLKDTIDVNSISLPEAEMSKALVAITAQAASIPAPRMKYIAKLRTVHYVYELPDYHPSLAEFDEREHDDPTPYLLAIWLPGETSNSLEYNNDQEETVKGTVLIPCRTANRGKFPLNGTYFQVNEVFADDETSRIPMDVPRCQLWNLSRRYLGCGTSATSIFKALSTSDIQRCFWKGSICVRGFNRKTRQPRPLHRRFHISTTAVAAENKRTGKR
ncbi:hypothetical protein L6452_00245 [Arctium lappa]|uniref:Uncharacterized protein n=1 Tax=Arctium lappa TaxID=4217 RepID=A0ACB9FE69_ARCLA|nr:hypothetical protein L6452_00245 [Arctium lappa]